VPLDDLTARFAALVALPPGELRLDEAALVIATGGAPDLDEPAALAELDRLAAAATPTLDGVLRVLREAGFAGAGDDYYEPQSSFLHEVLIRRSGIPISLGVVAMEVGRRAGITLGGVAMPGHFLVRADDDRFVDAYDGMRGIDRDEAIGIFARLHPGEAFDDAYLAPVSTHAILIRMLGNLAAIYRKRADHRSLLWVLRLRACLPAMGVVDQRELASVLALRGRWDEAADLLDAVGTPEDARTVLRLRARLN
jgi:regulator of sirC expression with transglutaminase-like and TPR domain